ncbi:protein OXIDATIVE STRESS 3 LIKE 1 [Cryptomeria japonica]|uniref:protein OXIDATIVE STRESS 3 LIKE 1 n=1 Tax=Cryptomeria japonica TaxID=3369 RepID=UPI0025ABF9A1|nr:protein OXIDATIVE STRESS 3 LIKE 1 [Cryptomeria japonica]
MACRRGISKFFTGKSRSFSSLSDAISIKDLSKPDNPYNKRRRNLLVSGNNWDRNRFSPTGISKKAIRSSKSTLALAVSMSNMEGYENELRLPPLPPLPPRAKFHSTGAPPASFSIRSFSLTDLQGIGSQLDFAKI